MPSCSDGTTLESECYRMSDFFQSPSQSVMPSREGLEPNGLTHDGLDFEGPAEIRAGGSEACGGQDLGRRGSAIHGVTDAEIEEVFGPECNFYLVRPGDRIPPWIAQSMASDPFLPQIWWNDESFELAANGVGIYRRPDPPRTRSPEESGAGYEAHARAILVTDPDDLMLDSSELESIEIGLRGFAGVNQTCARAWDKIRQAREARDAKRKAARDRAKQRRAEKEGP